MSKKNIESLQYGFGSWLQLKEEDYPRIRSIRHIDLTSRYVRQYSDSIHVYLFTGGSGVILKDGQKYPVKRGNCFVGNFLDLYAFQPDFSGLSYLCVSVNTAMISFIELSPHWLEKPMFPFLPFGLLEAKEKEFEELLSIGEKIKTIKAVGASRKKSVEASLFIELFCRLLRIYKLSD